MNIFKKKSFMNIKAKLKDKKGISTLEFVICFLTFILFFSFIFDLFMFSFRQFTISRRANEIIRILSNQSGVLATVPPSYPGGDKNYMNSTELYNELNKSLSGLGISSSDWKATVTVKDKNAVNNAKKSITLAPGKSIQSDYRDYIEFNIDYVYTWGLWSQLIPGTLKTNVNINRNGFCEYKYDYNTWRGEQ